MTKTLQRIGRVTVAAAAIILAITATAKLVSVWKLGGPRATSLGHASLVVPWLSEGWVLIIAALAEYILVAVVLLSKRASLRFGTLAWFAVVCLLYRYVLHAADGTASCNCAGVWNEGHQRISDFTGGVLLGLLALIGWVGSLAIAIVRWWPRVTSGAAGSQETDKRLTAPARAHQWLGRTAAIWLLVFTTLSGKGQSANYYEVQLQISQTNLYYTNLYSANIQSEAVIAKEKTLSYPARCVFGPNRWLIESHFLPNAVETYYHDGLNVYATWEQTADDAKWAEKFKKHYGRLPPTAEELKASGWISLRITAGQHPLANFGATFPWLAFCSGDYLREPGRLIPLGADMRHSLESFGFRDRTLVFQDRLGLPQRVELFTSAKLLRKSARNSTVLRSVRHPEAIQVALNPIVTAPEGFMAARYEVLDSTNIGGINIPLVFRFEFFEPGPDKKPLPKGEAWGRVTNLRAADEPPSILSSDRRFGVIDYRFRHPLKLVDEIQYQITNGIVPPVTDPVLRAIYRAKVSAAPYDPVYKARFGIYGLFAALVLLPVIIAALAWPKRKKQHTQNIKPNEQK